MDTAGELRPGDEGFDGFRMSLPENCVEYMIFVVKGNDDTDFPEAPSLETIRKAAVQKLDELAKDYIWQRDVFKLETKTHNGLTYLHGTTDYGDNVEDEWLIVFLLRELGKEFLSLWIRVFDSDGEFLLVEAAKVLPKWLSPENDSNRVWIHGGSLRIIPLAATPIKAGSQLLSLQDALEVIKSTPDLPLHSAFVEAEAFYRLEKYPGQIKDSQHHALVTIPRKLAYILHAKPAAVAPVAEAFYLRNPVVVKQPISPSFEPMFPPRDLVTVSIRFTKVLYAQLKSQRFEPLPAWKGLLQSADLKVANDHDLALSKLAHIELGMKVAAGFEILARNAHTSDSRLTREIALLLDDLGEDGDSVLPTDDDIRTWEDTNREDDDSWIDISYIDFEKELDGRGASSSGFGNAKTQADLKKIVSRFEAFLNDDEAGIEGAEVDEMNQDNDSDDADDASDSLDEDTEDEDKEISFDEEQFSRMMREMMGLPSGDIVQGRDMEKDDQGDQPARSRPSSDTEDEDEDEMEEIRKVIAQMESELADHVALALEPVAKKLPLLGVRGSPDRGQPSTNAGVDEEDADIDIDYNLAKNLLQSFKSQAGKAGPTGNLLGLMGMGLPRDEGDSDEEGK
ncbi:SGT1 protein-domain-containing protein [Lasiosphaeria miniovina]|uniref:SGT1 protein-domain-containing protein n=1 Tax=Lasiosphaeria miniovina TaxID=1954250 RepID=A0AA40ADM1_9PEZI|nr:SGT1 protein-domain-containing protein [Lasiosphaeria miniovina]KAK0713829.1 SGT1 protein-domain-containing protein [Lasiosphaeria miniovina]